MKAYLRFYNDCCLVVLLSLLYCSTAWSANLIAVPKKFSRNAIAIVSDSHANLPGLQAAINRAHELGVGFILHNGDVVGYGARPNECVALAQQHCDIVLKGNHDEAASNMNFSLDSWNKQSGAYKAMLWTRKNVSDDSAEYLQSLSSVHVMDDVLFVHASPLDPTGYTAESYIIGDKSSRENFEALKAQGMRIGVYGHTHLPALRQYRPTASKDRRPDHSASPERSVAFQLDPSELYLINPGSVGQPRNRTPLISFGIFEPDENRFTFERLSYDVEEAARAVYAADGLPNFSGKRIWTGE